MNNTIVVVSIKMKVVFQPISKGVFGIGVFGTIHMQAEVHENKCITHITKLKSPESKRQYCKKNKNKCILEQPVRDVICANQSRNPQCSKQKNKRNEPIVLAKRHPIKRVGRGHVGILKLELRDCIPKERKNPDSTHPDESVKTGEATQS